MTPFVHNHYESFSFRVISNRRLYFEQHWAQAYATTDIDTPVQRSDNGNWHCIMWCFLLYIMLHPFVHRHTQCPSWMVVCIIYGMYIWHHSLYEEDGRDPEKLVLFWASFV